MIIMQEKQLQEHAVILALDEKGNKYLFEFNKYNPKNDIRY